MWGTLFKFGARMIELVTQRSEQANSHRWLEWFTQRDKDACGSLLWVPSSRGWSPSRRWNSISGKAADSAKILKIDLGSSLLLSCSHLVTRQKEKQLKRDQRKTRAGRDNFGTIRVSRDDFSVNSPFRTTGRGSTTFLSQCSRSRLS